jgi:aminoglycoside/choline kinase family phosphotransferase
MEQPRLVHILAKAGEQLRLLFGPDVSVHECVRLEGQASNRVYHRLALAGADSPGSMILVQLPDDPFASEEASAGGGRQELPFCSVLRFLQGRGLPVPKLYADCAADGFILQEDLGPTTMFREMQASPDRTETLYRDAIRLLVRFQEATKSGTVDPSACIGYSRGFSAELLRWELEHFTEWGLVAGAGARLSPAENRLLSDAFDDVVRRILEVPYLLVHRDFQSTNLMLKDGRMVLIDFQDTLMGPPVYDLVSLLRDSYVSLPQPLLDHLRHEYFVAARPLLPFPDEGAFETFFHLQTLQRKLKDSGRFVFIDRVKGNPSFLRWVEPTLGYVASAFEMLPEYAPLHRMLARYLPALGGAA